MNSIQSTYATRCLEFRKASHRQPRRNSPSVLHQMRAPAEPDFFPKKFRWHPQRLYIFILITLLIYLIFLSQSANA